MAVVGHVEWVRFAHVGSVPRAGEVVHATDQFEELAGAATLVSALGDDEYAPRASDRLHELGVQVRASTERAPTRQAVTLVDDRRERTITTFGARLEPRGLEDGLWDAISSLDAVYFTAGDVDALRRARQAARVLVVSPRAGVALGHGIALDALVLSRHDSDERAEAERVHGEAKLVVWTEGDAGGSYRERSGAEGRWPAAELPGEPVDSYGCGDSFAAGLTYGLGVGLAVPDALALAARCGAMCLTGRGPYQRQLSL
jgi:ribokinase